MTTLFLVISPFSVAAEVLYLQSAQVCGLKEDVHGNLQNDGHELLATGTSPLRHISGGMIDVKMYLYVNIDTLSYFVVADIIKDDKACIMLGGDDFEVAIVGTVL